MRIVFPLLAVAALAACAPQGPDAAGGGSYGDYLKQAGSGDGASADAGSGGGQIAATGLGAGTGTGAGAGELDPNRPRGGDAPAGIQSHYSSLEYDDKGNLIASGQSDNHAAISDEQDFNAVKSRVSIQQDAARLAEQREQYQVINPEPLPARPSNEGPNLADYALGTTNNVGDKLYSRFNILGHDAYLRACARYGSPDLAQEAFLAAGGPNRDPKGLDPDGDGFACDWDPAPFRKAGK